MNISQVQYWHMVNVNERFVSEGVLVSSWFTARNILSIVGNYERSINKKMPDIVNK